MVKLANFSSYEFYNQFNEKIIIKKKTGPQQKEIIGEIKMNFAGKDGVNKKDIFAEIRTWLVADGYDFEAVLEVIGE